MDLLGRVLAGHDPLVVCVDALEIDLGGGLHQLCALILIELLPEQEDVTLWRFSCVRVVVLFVSVRRPR